MQFKSNKILALIFLMSYQLYSSNVHALEKKHFKIAAGVGLLTGAARYAWLEYKKPGEEKLTQFYKNRKEKNVIKYTGAGLLCSWIGYNIATDPKGAVNFIRNPENIHKFAMTIQSGFSLYMFYKLFQTVYKQNDMARVFKAKDIKERFSSVAGAHGAKEELQEVISFLKDPEFFEKLGTKIRRGVLLTGAPGNGKTLLAKATAGEANCSFLTMSGSEFVEQFVGTGAARVRKLFEKARSLAPCIIFIDEIDSLGGKRMNDSGSGAGSEHNQTLNELLTQMDGFEKSNAPIIIIGATNRPEMLDAALLRPGRFDSKIEVPLPDIVSREQILKVHAKNYKVDPSVDFNQPAKLTMGFSGADLANLINEASHIAAANKQQTITMENFSLAYDKVALGKETKTKVSEQERKITAYHEAGHALVQLLLPNSRTNLDKITIVPRGHAGGYTRFVNKEETIFQTREDLLNEVRISLGGRIAEEIIFKNVTGGASSDLENATRITRAMVCRLGMTTNLGTVVYNHHDHGSYSQDTGKKIDDEIRNIIQNCYKEVRELLEKNKNKLEALAQALLVQETLTGEQAAKVIGK